MNEKEVSDIENLLEKTRPQVEDYVEKRIHHKNFARAILWLCMRSNDDYVYANELAHLLGVSRSWAYEMLRNLCAIGLMVRKKSSGAEFWFMKDGDKVLIKRYLDKAKRTLDSY